AARGAEIDDADVVGVVDLDDGVHSTDGFVVEAEVSRGNLAELDDALRQLVLADQGVALKDSKREWDLDIRHATGLPSPVRGRRAIGLSATNLAIERSDTGPRARFPETIALSLTTLKIETCEPVQPARGSCVARYAPRTWWHSRARWQYAGCASRCPTGAS